MEADLRASHTFLELGHHVRHCPFATQLTRKRKFQVKLEKEKDGFPLTALREVNILLSFHHSNIVDVHEVVVGDSHNSVFMVMEYMEHDLKALMDSMSQPFSAAEVHRPPPPPQPHPLLSSIAFCIRRTTV